MVNSGEPTIEEIRWYANWDNMQDHLAIRHTCPCCGGKRTRWLRQEWNICFDCEIAFTFDDMRPVVDRNSITLYEQMVIDSNQAENERRLWEQIAYNLGGTK